MITSILIFACKKLTISRFCSFAILTRSKIFSFREVFASDSTAGSGDSAFFFLGIGFTDRELLRRIINHRISLLLVIHDSNGSCNHRIALLRYFSFIRRQFFPGKKRRNFFKDFSIFKERNREELRHSFLFTIDSQNLIFFNRKNAVIYCFVE